MSRIHSFLAAVLVLAPFLSNAQDKYGSRDGTITFFSHAPLEDITAVNHKAASVLVPATGAIEFSALIKAFEFKKAMMQEHFNENYLESASFPKAVFKGHVAPQEGDDLARVGTHKVDVVGTLTLHGVDKPLKTTASLEVAADGTIKGTCEFNVKPADHDISVPSVVREKIAEDIKVSVDITYTKL